MLKDLAHWPRLSLAISHEARSLILITLGSCPRIPPSEAQCKRPAQYPPTGRGYFIGRHEAASFILSSPGDAL